MSQIRFDTRVYVNRLVELGIDRDLAEGIIAGLIASIKNDLIALVKLL